MCPQKQKAEPKKKQFEVDEEEAKHYLGQIEKHLNHLTPPFQKFLLQTVLAKIPEKERLYRTECRQQAAIDCVLNIIQNWSPKQLYAAAKMLRKMKG